jgi:hypothetical protein
MVPCYRPVLSCSNRNLAGPFGLGARTNAALCVGNRDNPSWDGRVNVVVLLRF